MFPVGQARLERITENFNRSILTGQKSVIFLYVSNKNWTWKSYTPDKTALANYIKNFVGE